MCLLTLLFLGIHMVTAQQKEQDIFDQQQTKPFQLTLIYPVGSNGIASTQFENNVSLNLFVGASGGLNGVELGGFANVTRGNVKGVQLAGFSNVCTDSMKGVQWSGFTNYSNTTKGMQWAGLGNVTRGNSSGVQWAGFCNVALKQFKGLQVGGFANVAMKETGTQIGGLVNYAKKVKGLQLGVLNFADSTTGVPVGFFSYVKSGYHVLELSGNETFQSVLTFKTGTKRFYNIFAVGARWATDSPQWTIGYGVGTQLGLRERWNLDIDAVFHTIVPDSWKDDEDWNFYGKFNTSLAFNYTDKVAFFAGPNFNVFVHETTTNADELVPWSTSTQIHNNRTVVTYPGFNLGLRLHL